MQSLYPGLSFVDVSGVGSSGKSAVCDILREFATLWVSPNHFEFDFIRVPGGVLDLHHHLVEDWSPVRSHHAINDFIHVLETMGIDPKWTDLNGLIESSSQRYDRAFRGQFRKLAKEYVGHFQRGSYKSVWPYDLVHENSYKRFAKKIVRRLTDPSKTFVSVQLTSGANFAEHTTVFLNQLFSLIVEAGQTKVVLNNAFEAFNPARSLDLIKNSHSIIVTRDPRDIYVSGQSSQRLTAEDRALQANENDGFNKSFLASDDLDLFVLRYKTLMENVYRGSDPRVLKLRFEEIAFEYVPTLSRIRTHLQLREDQHQAPLKYFNPERSKKNIGLWRKYSKPEEIRYIEKELGEFLWT